jgi:hypothetical protein
VRFFCVRLFGSSCFLSGLACRFPPWGLMMHNAKFWFMNNSALIMMLLANGVAFGMVLYFFIRVLRVAPPDSVDEEVANYPRGG